MSSNFNKQKNEFSSVSSHFSTAQVSIIIIEQNKIQMSFEKGKDITTETIEVVERE